jgi:hypothetical protein
MTNGASLSIGQKAVAFARGKLGQQVGRGECYDVADAALRHAGAKSAPSYGETKDDGDYVWGDEIDAKDARAGDVIQFRDFVVTITTVTKTKIKRPDGGGSERTETATETAERGHHTAVVESNDGNGVLVILEQNVAPRGRTTALRKVQRNSVAWKAAEKRAPPKLSRAKNGAVTEVTTTISVAVEGTIWVYRPNAKE